MRIALVLLVFLAVAAGALPAARATIADAADVPALAAASGRVVLGRVARVQAGWDESGMRIRTRATVSVEETLRGEPSREVAVDRWGGTVGDIGQVVLGEAALAAGERVLLFLEPAGAGAWRTVGLAQGCWRATTDADGVTRVSRTAARLTLRVPGAAAGQELLVPDRGAPARPYAEVRAQVLAQGRSAP